MVHHTSIIIIPANLNELIRMRVESKDRVSRRRAGPIDRGCFPGGMSRNGYF